MKTVLVQKPANTSETWTVEASSEQTHGGDKKNKKLDDFFVA